MSMSSSSAPAADPSLHKYDVFISFRGETRNSFTSHLYSALCGKQIKTYIDEVSLEKGDDISRALPKAIEESAISIIIFSENYASSRWCLDELVHILKCRKENDQYVMPIFYGIDPSDIRRQKESYAAAFVKHEARYEDKMEKVQEWREALTEAANLSGWDSRNRSESIIVKEVVELVRTKLETIWSIGTEDLKGLVGIERRLEKIESLLCIGSPTVRIVGIWGMGGIGKTTLARVLFKRFSNKFEGSYFAPNVREESTKKGLPTLEKEVFSKLLDEKDLDVSKPFVNVRLRRRKVLLVLDDVDKFDQLQHLVGDHDRFCPGSKIIVTSRDFQVLKKIVDETYEAEELNYEEARELFYLNAFKRNSCITEFTEISEKVISKGKGNPLALGTLGSSLYSMGIKDWERALTKLNRIPNKDIQEVLRISYERLDAEEQGIFLDIACFFKRQTRDFVEGILDHKPIVGLVHKSLITIENGWIGMHDLMQEMGWEIVRESTKKLGERSRLWNAQDVYYVLKKNKGTEEIEGIYLEIPKIEEDLCLRPEVFEEMCNLRVLKIYSENCKVYFSEPLNYLPDSLRYLHWRFYPEKSLPSSFNPHNLVELIMLNSKLEQLWDGVQKFGSLKSINLMFSENLTKIPDLSLAPKLVSINFSKTGLIHVPSLNLQATLDEDSGSTGVSLSFHSCHNLKTISEVRGNITELDLSFTALEELPSSIESLENLRRLYLYGCKYLKSLPKLPRNIEIFRLEDVGLEQIPSSSIEHLCSLRDLSLEGCKSLESLLSNIWKLHSLRKLIWKKHQSRSYPHLLKT